MIAAEKVIISLMISILLIGLSVWLMLMIVFEMNFGTLILCMSTIATVITLEMFLALLYCLFGIRSRLEDLSDIHLTKIMADTADRNVYSNYNNFIQRIGGTNEAKRAGFITFRKKVIK